MLHLLEEVNDDPGPKTTMTPAVAVAWQVYQAASSLVPAFPLTPPIFYFYTKTMRSFLIACLASAATAFEHHPHPFGFPPHASENYTCISSADAALIATKFGLTISNYTEALAVQLLSDDFTDQSDSVNTLIHEPGLVASDVRLFLLSIPPPQKKKEQQAE